MNIPLVKFTDSFMDESRGTTNTQVGARRLSTHILLGISWLVIMQYFGGKYGGFLKSFIKIMTSEVFYFEWENLM